MTHDIATGIIAGLLLASAPAAAQQQQTTQNPMPVIKKYGEVGGWTILAASLEGQHMVCAAAPPGDAGKSASFELSSEGMTVLVATTTRGAEGDEVKGAYEIDGKATRIPFYRRENNRNMGFLKAPHAKQLTAGKGNAMTVTIGKEKLVIPLAGIAAALKAADQCNMKEGK